MSAAASCRRSERSRRVSRHPRPQTRSRLGIINFSREGFVI
jgi:hypothetical protein